MKLKALLRYLEAKKDVRYTHVHLRDCGKITEYDNNIAVVYFINNRVFDNTFPDAKDGVYMDNKAFFIAHNTEDNIFMETEITYEPEDLKEVSEAYLKNKMIEYAKSTFESEKKKREIELIELIDKYGRLKLDLVNTRSKIEKIKCVVMNEDYIEEFVKKIETELENIAKHKNCKSITLGDTEIVIVVDDVILTEPNSGDEYLIGSVDIIIELDNNKVYFEANENSEVQTGYWSNIVHPHIDGYGEACFGTADAQLFNFLSEKNYYAAYITALNFLQTCNTNDVAGKYVYKWKKKMPNGQWRYDYEERICADCGDIINETEEARECEHCGETFCVNCVIDLDGTYVCKSCYDEYYVTCDMCGKAAFKDDMHYINGDVDEWVCTGCYEQLKEEGEI